MENLFITRIRINKYRNIENLDIELSQDSRKHLIITGKNGSGKTSLINLLVDNLHNSYQWETDVAYKVKNDLMGEFEKNGRQTVGTIDFNISANTRIDDALMFCMPAEHLFHTTQPYTVASKNERYNRKFSMPKESVYQNIIQTMVTMRVQLLEAKENNDERLIAQSEKWLGIIKKVLTTIYESETLELKYVPLEHNYRIILDGYEFDLNHMADGFSAFFRIVSEIMEKMDYYTDYGCDYSLPGIAFIDELETHMHISMQKIALGFLTEMFPNVQFIVTTHSPFVITSLENAIVFDLSTRLSLEDPHQHSFESIIKGYYDMDMYSQKMKEIFNRYKELAFCERSREQEKEFSKLRVELQTISPAQKEVYLAFKDVENKRKSMSNG